jgi:predicted RNA binding protein YcfA (HicA-like mRNA interferase family)
MPKLTPIKPKKLIKIILSLGFVMRDAEGAHVFFSHSNGKSTVVSRHNKEIGRGLLRKILNDVGLSVERYEDLRKKHK